MRIKLFLAVYFLTISSLTFFSYFFIDPNLIYLKSLFTDLAYSQRFLVTATYITLIILLFMSYFSFIWLYKKRSVDNFVGKTIFIITLILLFGYPAMLSYDIFNYIATAKVLFHYHENPYIIMPIEFTRDPVLLFMHAANKTALYGFIWILLSGIPYLFGLNNFLLILFNFKLLAVVFYLGTLFLIWKITKNMFSVYLFGFNPLVILETLLGAHNDIVGVFFSLTAYYFLQKKGYATSVIFLFLSIFIKYTTVFLIPIFFFVWIQNTRKRKIIWNIFFYYSALLMLFVLFFIAPIREEIYPWYALWFFSFTVLIPKRRFFLFFSVAITFGLLFRYVPFMLLGTYFGPTPIIKTLVTVIPPIFVCIYFACKKYIWSRH